MYKENKTSEAECFHNDIFGFMLKYENVMLLYRSKLIYANQLQFKILYNHFFFICFNYVAKIR